MIAGTDMPGGPGVTGSYSVVVKRDADRILYEVDDEPRIVTIVRIGHRREVYR
jgi:mRNA-degrading endonuclease RelE of RelBE toxin-antitoxin system